MNLLARFTLLATLLLTLSICSITCAQEAEESKSKDEAKWFDGKTMDGWEKVGKKDSHWEVKDGALHGSGTQSMLVYSKSAYKNFRYRPGRLRSSGRQHAQGSYSHWIAIRFMSCLSGPRQTRYLVHL